MAEERVRIRDGSFVLIRPIEPRDKGALEEGLEHMSMESRYKRFFAPIPRLTRSQLRYFTEVDHHDHEALVAISEQREPVGVARYVRTSDEPGVAEAAVAVVDDWHNRGVATALLTRLAERARKEGIESFTATALADNREVLELLRDVGPARTRTVGDGTVEMRIELPVTQHRGARLWQTLRRAAEGRLRVRNVGSGLDQEDAH